MNTASPYGWLDAVAPRSVPLETPISDLQPGSLIVEGTDLDGHPRLLAIRFGPTSAGNVRATAALLRFGRRANAGEPDPEPQELKSVALPPRTTLQVAAMAVAEIAAVRAAHADLRWPLLTKARLLLLAPLAAVLTLASGLLPGSPIADAAAIMPAILMASMLLLLRVDWVSPSPRAVADGRRLRPHEIRALLQAAQAGPTPAERVDVVTAAYGALLADIVYRIENSALFDAAVPASQRFQIALVTWDPDAPDAAALATEVEESFAAARSHAEQLGLSHLPAAAQSPARRAAKALTAALAEGNPAEREAAARAAAGMLSGLSLYYLPVVDPQAPSLIAARRELAP